MGKGNEKPKRKTRCDKDWEWKRPPPLYEAALIEPVNTARRKMKEALANPDCDFNEAIQYAVARGNVNAVELIMAAAEDRDVSTYMYRAVCDFLATKYGA
eukprot:m.1099965 g.1099965  ORF g.1099965 m.1099965 type:complete len:100 (+) comp24319_c0_seq2:409-708(+)